MKIVASLAFLIASFVAAPTMVLAQDGDLEAILEELEEELGVDFEDLLEDLDPEEIAAIEAALDEALEDADNLGDLLDVINEAEGALEGLDGVGAIADEARAIIEGGGGGDDGGADVVPRMALNGEEFQTICMVGEPCDLRGEPVYVRDEYGKTICIRGACNLGNPEVVEEVVKSSVRDGIRKGLSGEIDPVNAEWQAKMDKIVQDPDIGKLAGRVVDEADNFMVNITGYRTREEAYAAGGTAVATEWSRVRRGISYAIGGAILDRAEEKKAEIEVTTKSLDRLMSRLAREYGRKPGT